VPLFLILPGVKHITIMKNLYLYIFLAIASAMSLRAETLDSLILKAYAQNPEMQSARADLITSLQSHRYAGAWANPELSLNLKDDAAGNDDGEGSVEIEFTQDISLTSAKQKEKDLSTARSRLAKASYMELARNTAYQLELLAIDLSENQESLELQGSFTNLYAEALRLLNDQVQRGEASALDLTQLTLSKASVEQHINTLQNQQQNILLKIKLMLNTRDEIKPDYSFNLDKDLPLKTELLQAALAGTPQYLVGEARQNQAAGRLALAKAKRWDDVSLHLFGEQEKTSDQDDELEENTLLGLGFSVKLPFWNQNKASIQEAQSAQDLSEKRQAILLESLKLSVENARENLIHSHKLALQSSGEILTLAEQNSRAYQDAYLQGQASLVQVQRAREQQLELKNKAIESLVNYHKAKAQLRYLLNNYPTLEIPE